jgi:hypothetical protein
MKKIILGLSGIFVAGFVFIMVANAQNNPQEVKKAATEVAKKDCPKGPSSSCCAKMSESKSSDAKVCDPAKCKEGKCDPAKCKGPNGEAMKCDPAACKGDAKKQ